MQFTDSSSWVALAQAGDGGGGFFDTFGMWPPLIVIGLLFYFMLIWPERKRKREHEEMLANLKKNDRIVTVGGIYGTIVNVQKDAEDVSIKVDESSNTRLRITRNSIGRVIRDTAANDPLDAGDNHFHFDLWLFPPAAASAGFGPNSPVLEWKVSL